MTIGIRAFLDRWADTRGFGLKWRLIHAPGYSRLRTGRAAGVLGCPLTALYGREAAEYGDCGRALGLDLHERDLIACAADSPGCSHCDPAIRAALLAGVGLSEEPCA